MHPSLKRTLLALALATIILCSFAALLNQQKSVGLSITIQPSCLVQVYSRISNLQTITISTYFLPTLTTTSFSPNINVNSQEALTNGTRTQIYNYIAGNPGVQFRGICAALGLPIGLAQYHLGVLIKAGLVSFIRDGRYKRFFQSKKFSRKDMFAISILWHQTARRILEALLREKQLAHGELACKVSITSQGLTWQMKRLGKTDFIIEEKKGLRTFYSIAESSAPLLVQYLTIVEEKP